MVARVRAPNIHLVLVCSRYDFHVDFTWSQSLSVPGTQPPRLRRVQRGSRRPRSDLCIADLPALRAVGEERHHGPQWAGHHRRRLSRRHRCDPAQHHRPAVHGAPRRPDRPGRDRPGLSGQLHRGGEPGHHCARRRRLWLDRRRGQDAGGRLILNE